MAALQFVRRSQGTSNSTRYLMSVLPAVRPLPQFDGTNNGRKSYNTRSLLVTILQLQRAVYDFRDRLRQEIVRQQSRVSDVNYT